MAEPSVSLNEYYTACPNNIKIGLWGDNEAPNFDVGQFVSYITEVNINRGDVVNGLEINYVDIYGQNHTLQAGTYNLVGCEKQGFKLKSGECITGVSGYFKGYDGKVCISRLEFTTDSGNKYGPYGSGGGQKFTVKVTVGNIIGFFGLGESYIHSIGFYLGGNAVSVNLN